MKRSPMPGRRAALARRTPLRTRAAAVGARSVRSAGRRAGEAAGRRIVRARSGGLCEACGCRKATDWQHRQNRSQLGDWSPVNGLHVCGLCHGWIHAHPLDAWLLGWTVRSHEDPADRAVWRRGDAWVLLTADGDIVPVLHYTGSPCQCLSHLPRERGSAPSPRCALGVRHDGDHENGLMTWPQTSEEREAWTAPTT